MATDTVKRYLRDLEAELRDVPASRRRELVEEIRDHIESALSDGGTEADVRNVLDRLGDPVEIAREARERFGIERVRPGWREAAALILLPVGGVILPVIGWVIGAILLLASPVWTTRERLVGLLLFPGGLLPAVVLLLLPSRVCTTVQDSAGTLGTCPTGPNVLAIAALAVLVAVPIATTWFLASRMRRRATA